MKLSFFLNPIFTGLLSTATANFDVYFVRQLTWQPLPGNPGGFSSVQEGFQIFQVDPTRDDVSRAKFFSKRTDVSGDKIGVACDGSDCNLYGNPANINRLEMNFGVNPTWHWSE